MAMWLELTEQSCKNCGLLTCCPCMRQGELTDLSERHHADRPGWCTSWRPAYLAPADGAPGHCGDCHYCDGGTRCGKLVEIAREVIPTRVYVGTDAALPGCSMYAAGGADEDLDAELESEFDDFDSCEDVGIPMIEDEAREALAAAQAENATAIADPERLAVVTAEVQLLSGEVLRNILQIGKRLIEIKQLVGHGRFGSYVKENCGYSHDVANRFMKVAEQYTEETLPVGLSVSKVYELLSLPEAERAAFVEKHDVEGMTVRQLRAELAEEKQRNVQLSSEAVQLKTAARKAKEEAAGAEGARKRVYELQATLRDENASLREQLRNARAARPETVTVEVEKVVPPDDYEAMKAENESMREQLQAQKYDPFDKADELVMDDLQDACEKMDETLDAIVQSFAALRLRAREDLQLLHAMKRMVDNIVSYAGNIDLEHTLLMEEARKEAGEGDE